MKGGRGKVDIRWKKLSGEQNSQRKGPEVGVYVVVLRNKTTVARAEGESYEDEVRDIPGDSTAKTPCYQCRMLWFDPWSGNWIPHAKLRVYMSQLKIPCATTEARHSQINKDEVR